MVFLNIGGLWFVFLWGNVMVGDVFKLMFFDNQVVFLKMFVFLLMEMVDYLKVKGGDFIVGMNYNSGILMLNVGQFEFFWVVIMDFFVNGGDKMYFFSCVVECINMLVLFCDVIFYELNQCLEIFYIELQQCVKLQI